MVLAPLTTFRASTNRAWLMETGGRRWLVKHYIGNDAEARRDCEARRLTIWNRHGFRVPKLEDVRVTELEGKPHLVMEFIEARTLQEVLKDSLQPLNDRLQRLRSIVAENRRRHDLALKLQEPGLLHHDPNTSNVLCPPNETCCFIDFEGEVAGWQVEFIAIEIAKLFRWAARDLGRPEIDTVAALFFEAYAGRQDWLQAIAQRTLERRFQFYHRWQDGRRKRNAPGEVTKYDVADSIRRLL